MRIFNQNKTVEIENPDLEKGYLIDDELVLHHEAVDGVEEQGHYEVVRVYPSGGKDVEWKVDVPKVEGHEAYDEIEDIKVYVEYTEEELRQIALDKEILSTESALARFKECIAQIDYRTIKYIEGELTEEEFRLHKIEKQELRKKINELEEKLKELKESKPKEE